MTCDCAYYVLTIGYDKEFFFMCIIILLYTLLAITIEEGFNSTAFVLLLRIIYMSTTTQYEVRTTYTLLLVEISNSLSSPQDIHKWNMKYTWIFSLSSSDGICQEYCIVVKIFLLYHPSLCCSLCPFTSTSICVWQYYAASFHSSNSIYFCTTPPKSHTSCNIQIQIRSVYICCVIPLGLIVG